MTRLLPLLLASCASLSLQYGEPSPRDVRCGVNGSLSIRTRPGCFVSCEEALDLVDQAVRRQPGHGFWTVLFSNEPAGVDVGGGMEPVPKRGMTYPATRVVAVQGDDLRVLVHELGHASDFDEGIANRRDW